MPSIAMNLKLNSFVDLRFLFLFQINKERFVKFSRIGSFAGLNLG